MAKFEINRPIKIAKRRKTTNLLSRLKKRKNIQNLTIEKPSKIAKLEINQNVIPQNNQQLIKSKNKDRIEVIREQLRELAYKLSKSELKEIKKRLYMVENKKGLLESKETEKYLDKLDKKTCKLDKYYHDDDFEYRGIRNIRDLFISSVDEDYYKPTLVKSSYNNICIQYESKGDNILTVKEYLNLIEPYLADMINDYKNKDEWKIQLPAEINFTSLKPDSNEKRTMYVKSDNVETRIGDDTNDVIKELFKSFLQRYQESLPEKMRGSDFEFDAVNLLYYDFNKISLDRSESRLEPANWTEDDDEDEELIPSLNIGWSYIESPKWIKSTINPKNNDDKCFQYAVTVALNYNKINKNPQRVSKIKPFIDQYNWKDVNFPSTGKDWKKFELNNKSIALNIFYVPHRTKKIHLAYKSKHNLAREKQVILLMITDGKNGII